LSDNFAAKGILSGARCVGSNPGLEATYTERDSIASENLENRSKSCNRLDLQLHSRLETVIGRGDGWRNYRPQICDPWSDFEGAKVAVATEASALRGVVLLAGSLPAEQQTRLRSLIERHIENAVHQEWPAMAQQNLTLTALPAALIEALQDTLALKPSDDGQRTAQREIVSALHAALDARRQRIIISQSTVSSVKWTGLLLQALCTLIAIAIHSDNRLTCGMALTLFATGIALSVLLIASYSRPFTGEISVGPELLKQVITSEATFSR